MGRTKNSHNKKDQEEEVSEKISSIFSKQGFTFQRDVIVNQSSTDYYAVSPTGTSSIYEVKLWDPSPVNIERASKIAKINASGSGVLNSFVILPLLTKSQEPLGVISIDDMDKVVANYYYTATTSGEPSKVLNIREQPKDTIFVAMPFLPKYDDTFLVAMGPAAHEVNAECVRVDHIERLTRNIVTEICSEIKKSIAVIADISESRPNVLYEIGYAHASGKEVIQICSTEDDYPFDVSHNPTIKYNPGQTSKLKDNLTKKLKAVLNR
jgi:hypothetical protein